MVEGVRRRLLGRRLRTVEAHDERLNKRRALGAFGLDALSSVAYGPDEILYVLILAGAVGTRFSLPVALAIVALLAIVVTSYRQTLYAYPNGGGSYTVARENLGTPAGLLAAAALMVDYLATVAVSVTAGVEALIALAPGLNAYRVPLDVVSIVVIMLVNLRGVREAGAFFVLPTYVFIGSLALLLGWGLLRLVTGDLPHLHASPVPATQGVTLFLLLRAFAGGCTAMTGVEAISNGVPVFEEPEPRNAARTLVTLAVILGAFVLGVTGLGNAIGAVPSDRASVIAQIGQVVAGGGPLFWLVQLSSAVILILAANTPFNGFPMLAAIMAQDSFLPQQFEHRGLRLSYYNGILIIGTLAIGLVVLFGGRTHALIPLYAVGVFLCFTLSQSGMVRHWLRVREPRWRIKLAINGLGALVTGLVTAIVVIVKFPEGAWLIVLIVPALMVLFVLIHRYYQQAGQEIRVWRIRPPEQQPREHTVLVPIADLNRPTVESLAYACSISERVTAVHVCLSHEEQARFRRQWEEWGTDVPLVQIYSPYRLIVEPLLDYIDERQRQEPGELVTVVLPELVPMHWWENALHNQIALRMKLALFTRPGTVVTSVPYHLQN